MADHIDDASAKQDNEEQLNDEAMSGDDDDSEELSSDEEADYTAQKEQITELQNQVLPLSQRQSTSILSTHHF